MRPPHELINVFAYIGVTRPLQRYGHFSFPQGEGRKKQPPYLMVTAAYPKNAFVKKSRAKVRTYFFIQCKSCKKGGHLSATATTEHDCPAHEVAAKIRQFFVSAREKDEKKAITDSSSGKGNDGWSIVEYLYPLESIRNHS